MKIELQFRMILLTNLVERINDAVITIIVSNAITVSSNMEWVIPIMDNGPNNIV